jgi:hypothetical protein
MVKYVSAAAVAAALLFGATANAHAAERTDLTSQTAQQSTPAPWSLSAPRQSLQWDSKGKWGLRLGMAQPTLREPDWKDMQAGAFFRITPSLRVGGSVQFGDRLSEPKQVTPRDAATPRVHLETAFRF